MILCVIIICGTMLLLNSQNSNDNKNQSMNNSNNTTNITNNTTTNNMTNENTNKVSSNSKSSNNNPETDDEYIEGKKITYRNKNYMGEDSGLEEFSTNEAKYIKQKSTGKIAKRHLDDDGVYRYYDMQTGQCVL